MSDPVAMYAVAAFVVAGLVARTAFPLEMQVRHALTMMLASLVLLLPLYGRGNTVDIVAVTLVLVVLRFALHRVVRDGDATLALTAFVTPLVVYLVFADSRVVTGFNAASRQVVESLFGASRAISLAEPRVLNNLCVYVAGAILATVEANHLVKLVLRRLELAPRQSSGQVELITERDVGRGRAIGYLERALVFALVLSGNVPSIGFVLAAKAFTRFRELDSREFAEYVLVGTLLSVGLAAAVAGVFGRALA